MATTSLEQRVQMARRGYDAFNEMRLDQAMETIADDIVWHVGGNNPLTGEYVGKVQVTELFAKFALLTEGTYEAVIHDILASEEHTVVVGTYTATRGPHTHTARFVDVIHPTPDGKAKEFWRFPEDTVAEDAFFNEKAGG